MQKEKSSVCPALSVLSAYFDGEEQGSDSLEDHVQSCKTCQNTLKNMEIMQNGIKAALNRIEPDGIFAKQICEKIQTLGNQKIPENEKPLWFHGCFSARGWFLRTAVLLVLAAVFIYLLNLNQNQEPNTGRRQISRSKPAGHNAGGAEAEFQSVPVKTERENRKSDIARYATPAAVTYRNNPLEYNRKGQFGVLDITRGGAGYSTNESFTLNGPVYFSLKVNHTWINSNLSQHEMSERLKYLQKTLCLNPGHCSYCKNGTLMHVKAELNQRQLVLAAKQLSAWGLNLMSVRNPQPHQNLFYGDGGSKCEYEIDIINRKTEFIADQIVPFGLKSGL